jgi:hypothetical protein
LKNLEKPPPMIDLKIVKVFLDTRKKALVMVSLLIISIMKISLEPHKIKSMKQSTSIGMEIAQKKVLIMKTFQSVGKVTSKPQLLENINLQL